MVKRLQVVINSESWAVVESAEKEANDNFNLGNITYSDVINEMIVNSKIDYKVLQQKHINLKKTLKLMANQDIDLDTAIKQLLDLKQKNSKKKIGSGQEVITDD